MTGNDRPGRACAAQSEDDMVNKVRVTIAGAPYAIATTDTENYITTLAKKLDDDITKLLDNNGNLSVTKRRCSARWTIWTSTARARAAPRICAARYRLHFRCTRAKLAADKVKAENETLKRENAALREQLAKLQQK